MVKEHFFTGFYLLSSIQDGEEGASAAAAAAAYSHLMSDIRERMRADFKMRSISTRDGAKNLTWRE